MSFASAQRPKQGEFIMGFSVSSAYSEAMRMVRERFWPLLAILAMFFVITIGVMFVFGASMLSTIAGMASGPPDPAALGAGFVTTYALVYLVIYFISLASMAAMVTMASPAERPGIGDAIVDGFKSAPSLFAVLIMVGIGFGIVAVVLSFLGGAAQSAALGMVVLLAIVALGCWIFTKLSLVVPLVAIDGVRNPITAMTRSWSLTTGSALKIFAAWFLFWVVVMVVLMIVVFAFAGSIAGGISSGQTPGIGTIVLILVFYLAFVVAINLFVSALTAAVHAQLAGPAAAMAETFE